MNSLSLFYRRPDEAVSALVHRYTRRDWSRTRLWRLNLLVRRKISPLVRQAAPELNFSIYATSCRLSAQALARCLERVVNRVDCQAYRVLLDHLLIERSNLHACRVFQWQYWESLDDLNKARIQCPVMTVLDPTSKQYGKLLKSLGQRLAFDPLHDKRRFHIRYWHRHLAPLLQLSARPFRSTKVVSPP